MWNVLNTEVLHAHLSDMLTVRRTCNIGSIRLQPWLGMSITNNESAPHSIQLSVRDSRMERAG